MALPLAQTGNTIVQLGAQKSPFSADSQDGYDEWGSVTINGRKFVCPTDGYFTVKGAARNYRWDVQNGPMLQGAIQFLRGITPTEFTLECAFWAESQYAAFLEVVAGFQYNLKNIRNTQDPASTAATANANALAVKARQATADAKNSPDNTDLERQAIAAQQAATDAKASLSGNSGNALGQLIVRAVTIYHPALDLVGINQVNIVAAGAPEKVSDDGMWHAEFKLREYSPPIQLPPQDKDTAPLQPGDPIDPAYKDKANTAQQLYNQAFDPKKWVSLT